MPQKPLQVAIYARLSVDRTGEAESPERQVTACRQLAESKGWHVVGKYIDRDASAYSTRGRRPQFDALLSAVEAGTVGGVLVWKLDRFGRRMYTAVDAVRRINESGAVLVSVVDSVDTSTAMGRGFLAVLFSMAEAESENVGRRVSLAWQSAAAQGRPHAGGVRCFGFTNACEQIPKEAAEGRRAADKVLAGESLGSIVKDLNTRGVKTVGSKQNGPGQWTVATLRRWLVAPTVAGLRSHHGEITKGTWRGIVTPEERERLLISLGETRQPGGVKTPPAYLLSGIAQCTCGQRMAVKKPGHGRPFYACRRDKTNSAGACGKVYASVAGVDAYVVDGLADFLAAGKIEPIESAQDPAKITAAIKADTEAVNRLNRACFVERTLNDTEWQALHDELRQRIAANAAALTVVEAGARLPVGDRDAILAWWESATLEQRREAIRDTMRITIKPATGRSPVFDTSRVDIRWRSFSGAGVRIRQRVQGLTPEALEAEQVDWPEDDSLYGPSGEQLVAPA